MYDSNSSINNLFESFSLNHLKKAITNLLPSNYLSVFNVIREYSYNTVTQNFAGNFKDIISKKVFSVISENLKEDSYNILKTSQLNKLSNEVYENNISLQKKIDSINNFNDQYYNASTSTEFEQETLLNNEKFFQYLKTSKDLLQKLMINNYEMFINIVENTYESEEIFEIDEDDSIIFVID